MEKFRIPPRTRDISAEALDASGRMRVLPESFWETTTADERAMLGYLHGIYSFPTTELVERVREIIGDRRAIEIGAGHGVFAEALGITATDSKQQLKPEYRDIYLRAGQPPVRYGPNVETYDALSAVSRYKPKVVVACWVTHKYDHRRHHAGGNEAGVDEKKLLSKIDTYVFVGNEKVHEDKDIWELPHVIEYPTYVYSRAVNGTRDFLAVWNRQP